MDLLLMLALVPFGGAVLLSGISPRLAERIAPRAVATQLTVATVALAAGCGFALSLVAFTLLARTHPLVALGHWSPRALGAHDAIPPLAGLVPAAVLLASAAAGVRALIDHARSVAIAQRSCRLLGPAHRGLVVVDTPERDAFTLCGLVGRIVITTGLLRALPADERRAVLAHESSHLRHRHDLYIHLTQLAAATNPLLRRPARLVRISVERWADQDAARAVGDHNIVIRALAHTHDPDRRPQRLGPTTAETRSCSRRGPRVRTARTQSPVTTRGHGAGLGLATTIIVAVASTLAIASARIVETRFEQAQSAYRATATWSQ